VQQFALVPAVLLRMAGLNALEADAEAQPPDESRLRPKRACEQAKGTPLSVRITPGSPKSLKARSNTVKAVPSQCFWFPVVPRRDLRTERLQRGNQTTLTAP
jgi:hypothetical protein